MKKFVAPKQYANNLAKPKIDEPTPTKSKNNLSLLSDILKLLPKLNLNNLFSQNLPPVNTPLPPQNQITPSLNTYNFQRTASILEKNRNQTQNLQNEYLNKNWETSA